MFSHVSVHPSIHLSVHGGGWGYPTMVQPGMGKYPAWGGVPIQVQGGTRSGPTGGGYPVRSNGGVPQPDPLGGGTPARSTGRGPHLGYLYPGQVGPLPCVPHRPPSQAGPPPRVHLARQAPCLGNPLARWDPHLGYPPQPGWAQPRVPSPR